MIYLLDRGTRKRWGGGGVYSTASYPIQAEF